MRQYNIGQNFKSAISTKKTLFGAPASAFLVSYAPISDLTAKTPVDGGMSEAVESVADAHTATTTSASAYGSRVLVVDGANSTIEAGDTIEYSSGKFAYVMKMVGDKLYLKTPIRAAVESGATITQVGNTGEYVSADIAISGEGEYAITIEASEYGIVVEDRVRIVDSSSGETVDTDAPVDTVAVAY